MSLGGSYEDNYVRKYSDMLEHELQQNGSVLKGLVTLEPAMGERTSFNKIGVATSYQRVARYEAKQIGPKTFERRSFTPILIESNEVIDRMDLVRYASNPQSDLIDAQIKKLGRDLDDLIVGALGGTAERTLNNVSSPATFLPSQEIAVDVIQYNNPTFPVLNGDTPLTEGKLHKAKSILKKNHIDRREEIYVVGSAAQFTNLQARASGNVGFMMRNKPNINLLGIDDGLDGYLGMRYILCDRMGVDANDNEYVYVFTKSAVKLGEWQPLKVDLHKRHDIASSPDEITSNMGYGAVRMFEEKVVRIACNPA